MQCITIYNRAFHIRHLVIVQKTYLIAFQDCDSQRVGGTVKIQPNSPGMPSTPHCQPPPKIHYPK